MSLYDIDENTYIDEYGTDHSGFSLADEIAYNFKKAKEKEQQQLTMPTYEQYQMMQPKESAWEKFKNFAENTGDAMQAGAVGYATGASLGNFDEAMGAATAALTANSDNYAMGRNATRQLQNNLQQQHPYIYGGAEIAGATTASMITKPVLLPIIAGIGYADNTSNSLASIGKNAAVSRFTRGIQKIGILPEKIRHLSQNAASWYLQNEENQQK